MSTISDKLTDAVMIKRRQGYDDTGAPLYDTPEPLLCRVVDDRRIVKDATGHEVVSERVLYTEQPNALDDALVIDGKDTAIIRVAHKRGVYGGYDHTEARL